MDLFLWAMFILVAWILVGLVFGLFLGKMIRGVQKCDHDWDVKGYGGAGWTLVVCKKCGERELISE